MRRVVSKITPSQWNDPFTPCGVRLATLPDGLDGGAFQIHEAGRITLDAQWAYSRVCSPFWRLYHNARPGAAVRVGAEEIELRPGMVVLLPPFVVFDCVPTGGVSVDHLWLHFSTPLQMPQDRKEIAQQLSPLSAAIAARLRDALSQEVSVESLRHLAMAWLHTLWSEHSGGEHQCQPPRLRRVCAFIEQRLATPPDLNELAAAAGLSPNAFIRWFKQEAGATPMAFVLRRRIIEACRLLRYSDLSIKEVAEATGFANRYHFSRVFVREVGNAPGAFRRQTHSTNP